MISRKSAGASGKRPNGSRHEPPSRQAILVLGMHRSGTSAVTRVVSLLGADLPKNLLGARRGNEAGHWESSDLLAIHEEMLVSAGSYWDDWTLFSPNWHRSGAAQGYKERIIAVLREDFENSSLFTVKDPRICRFVPFWLDVLETFGAQPIAVISLRNPLEVAQSLKERDGFCLAKGYLMWLRHLLDAERATRGVPRAIITYDRLLSDWAGVVAEIGVKTKVIWPRQSATTEIEVERFLAPGLRHHSAQTEELLAGTEIVDWVKDAHLALVHMAEAGDNELDRAQLDRIHSELTKSTLAFGPPYVAAERELRAREQETVRLKEELTTETAQLAGRAQEFEAGVVAYRGEAERVREALLTLQAEHDKTSSQLARCRLSMTRRE